MNEAILRLEQSIIENRYSKKQAKQRLLEKIQESEALKNVMNQANNAIVDWLLLTERTSSGKVWVSKNMRKEHIRVLVEEQEIQIKDIVYTMMSAVMQTEGYITIQTFAGMIANIFKFENTFDGIQTSAEIIGVCQNCGLYEVIHAADSETGTILIEALWTMDDEAKRIQAEAMYLPPMVCKPDYVESNYAKFRITQSESIILKGYNHHNEKQNYHNLNMLNRTALALDENVLQYEEEPTTDLDTPEKVANFELMRSVSRDIYNLMMEQGNCHYTPWKYDKRGREYSQGYHAHLQGSPYKKALINLHHKEVITL